MTRYIRTRPTRGDTLATAAVSLAVGAATAAVTFWVVRLFVAREPVERLPPPAKVARLEAGPEGGRAEPGGKGAASADRSDP